MIRLIEWEPPITTSQAVESVFGRFIAALDQQGKTVIKGGRHMGIILLLTRLLEHLRCQDLQETAHVINFSAGTPEYETGMADTIRSVETMGVFLLNTRMLTQRELTEVEQQMRHDLASPDFLGLIFFVSAWGRKPLTGK